MLCWPITGLIIGGLGLLAIGGSIAIVSGRDRVREWGLIALAAGGMGLISGLVVGVLVALTPFRPLSIATLTGFVVSLWVGLFTWGFMFNHDMAVWVWYPLLPAILVIDTLQRAWQWVNDCLLGPQLDPAEQAEVSRRVRDRLTALPPEAFIADEADFVQAYYLYYCWQVAEERRAREAGKAAEQPA